MANNKIDSNRVLKCFEFTAKEYLQFHNFFQKEDEKDTDRKYIELQTKLIILRKFDYNRENIYMPNVFSAVRNLFPEQEEKVGILEFRFSELNNYCMEVILCDGTSLNLHDAIEDVTYGLYLHADKGRIERLVQTDLNLYMIAVKEYVELLGAIVIDTYELIKDILAEKYERKNIDCAPVIFLGNSTNENHAITNSPYWKNLYGKDISGEEYITELAAMPEEDLEIYMKGFIFISELGKEKYSRNVLDGLVFPPTRSDWGDFSTIHEAIIKEPNIGFSNKIRYNDGHDIAYMHLWKNVDGGFLIDQPHKVQDITALTFVKESEKYGWRIYKIGEPADHFKETGSLFDWLKYVIKELRKS